MGASITLAGESLIAQKQGAQQILTVSRFILANVPGLDPDGPVDRAAGKPAAGQIVGTYDVTDAGYVNPNQVVYSLMLGSDIGDFDWNWIGLETAENVLLMVAYVPTQQKRRNIPPLQLGNNVTRNFLVVFDGAQALTGLTIDASTWQHDFTVRLAGIDERERQSNRDFFGRACFFGSALQLEKVGAVYQLKPGTAYVEGVRLQRSAALPVVPPAFPTTAWLDVALQRQLSDVVASWSVVWGAGKVDYVDSAGVQHYCVAIADLPNSNTITDSRPVESIAGPLVAHFAARVGDYAGLRARATTKDDVGLGNLPNSKSDDENTDSSLILATTKAVKAASALIWSAIANIVSGVTVVGKAERLATARNINGVPFNGTADINVTDASKFPLVGGTLTGPAYFSGNGGGVNGISSGNGDDASSTINNLKLVSWFGIGFGPSIAGMAVPAGQYSHWFDVRTGNLGWRGFASGNGSGLTSLNASNLASGTIPDARIPGLDWSKITSGKPTTLGGYGITNAVQLGTGIAQLGNLVKLGWDGGCIRATVDNTDMGQLWVDNTGAVTKVGNANVSLGLGGVGTYAFARPISDVGNLNQGATLSGSQLLFSSTTASDGTAGNSGLIGVGTWRCHGALTSTSRSLWLRIA